MFALKYPTTSIHVAPKLMDQNLLDKLIDQRISPIKKIGSGSFGEIYCAEYEHRLVALKIIKKQTYVCSKKTELEWTDHYNRIRTAFKLRSKIENPNLQKLYSFGKLDSCTIFTISEFLEGHSLINPYQFGNSAKLSAISQNSLLRLSLDLASAINSLHSRDITHNDISPSNVVLTKRGAVLIDLDSITPSEVLDFGIVCMNKDEIILSQTHEFTDNKQKDIYQFGTLLQYYVQENDSHQIVDSPTSIKIPLFLRKLIDRCVNQNNRPDIVEFIEEITKNY